MVFISKKTYVSYLKIILLFIIFKYDKYFNADL